MSEKDIHGVRICSVDAKDLYIADHLSSSTNTKERGYSVIRKDGTVNIKKFINTLDYSLDLIKLREVYQKVYRNNYFSFWNHGYEFTTKVINVTFKYSCKEFNHYGNNLLIKYGYLPGDIELSDGVCIRGGELIAVDTSVEIQNPLGEERLLPYFTYSDKHYQIKKNRTLHSVNELREYLYKEGFWCDGVHYIRFKRSAGSSRVGKCLFIDEKLYPAMHKYETLGLKIRKGQVIDLAAYEAYIALTLSSIIDTLYIDPKSILVIDDYDSTFKDKVMTTRIKNTSLVTQEEEVEITNTIWDGQSIIDSSIMGKYAEYGMVLLRNNFFKSCAFNGNIQQYFKDNSITRIDQLNGFTLAERVEDIKLITTPSSIKFIKFGTLEEWLTRISGNFGVVKHEKKTHYLEGRMVQTHYQLINTLQMTKDEVREFLQPTFDYLNKIKTDPSVLRYHIHYPSEYKLTNKPLKSKNDIIFKLMGLNDDFTKTQWYADFRTQNIKSYKNNARYGHILIGGNYSTLLGNPIEMLMQSIGQFNGKSILGIGNVSCKRFGDGEKLLGSRSPHPSVGSILLVNNIKNELIDKYFNLTNEIVCINSIGENILQKLNGADFDSDTVLLTNNKLLIKVAERNYHKFLVPTNLVESSKTKRYYTAEQKADLDIKTSVNKIGDIINKSQELQTYMWHLLNNGSKFEDIQDLYKDICQLSVMSNTEIDRAKKEFSFDNTQELNNISARWDRRDENNRMIKPYFFGHVAQTKGYYNDTKKNYMHHDTAMDYLEEIIDGYRAPVIYGQKRISITEIFDANATDGKVIDYDKVEAVLNKILEFKDSVSSIYAVDDDVMDATEKRHTYNSMKYELINYINEEINPNADTLLTLLKRLELPKYKNIRGYLVTVLFNIKNSGAFELIKRSKQPVALLEIKDDVIDDGAETEEEVVLYNLIFCKKHTKSPENT